MIWDRYSFIFKYNIWNEGDNERVEQSYHTYIAYQTTLL